MITINPENPTSDDNVEIGFTTYCPLPEISYSIGGSQFVITASPPDPPPPCTGIDPPVPQAWSVGRIQSGEYQVVLNYYGFDQEIQSFSVAQGQLPFPSPSIPALGIPAIMLLAVALGWLANKALKPTPKGAA